MAVICKIRSLTDVVSTVETLGVILRLWGRTSEGTINSSGSRFGGAATPSLPDFRKSEDFRSISLFPH